MSRLELSSEETQVLAKTLERALSELHTEIHHTDDPDYRNGLKQEESVLKGLAERLGA